MNIRYIENASWLSFMRPALNRVQRSQIGLRLVRGVFWSVAGVTISRGLMFIASIFVARILGKTAYGELGMINSTVGMFGVFAGFGLGLTATKHVAEFRERDPDRTGRIIGLSWVVAFVTGSLMTSGLLMFAPWLAEHTINAPHLTNSLRIGALILFLSAIIGAQTGVLSGFEAFRTIARVNLFAGSISFPLLVIGTLFGGLTGSVWAMVINLCVIWFLNHTALRKESKRFNITYTNHNLSQEFPILWNFSLPAVLSGILVSPANWICRAMLVNQTNGYDEMGIFTASLVFQNMLLVSSGMINAPLLSILSNTNGDKNRKLEIVNILSSWGIALFPAIPLLLFPEIVEMLFGSQYRGHSLRNTFSIIVFYTCIVTYGSGLLRVLQSRNLLWWGLLNNLFWISVLLPISYFLVKWGSVGLAASFAMAYVITSIVFIPVYVKCGEVSKGILYSKDILIVWFIIVALVAATFWNIPLVYRAVILPLVLYSIMFQFGKIWKRNTYGTKPALGNFHGKTIQQGQTEIPMNWEST